MMTIKHIIALILTLMFFAEPCYSQTEILNLNTNVSNNNGASFIARDKITMNGNFKFKRTGNEVFRAKLDETLLLNADYQAAIDPITRPFDYSLPVGTTAGSFNVSLSGAATYNIPIIVPPGSAGVEPNIAISYSSQAGDGVLGIGWNIAGLSSISRTSKTIFHDGVVGKINLDSEDRLALDGNRLITTDTYGEDAVEYHTEIETFSKITSLGEINSNNNWFKVETKDGRTIEYGNGINSRITVGDDGIAVAWLISKVTDASNNYITFSYRNIENLEFVIDKISYTGNASTVPYNSINFYYEFKPDYNISYVAGFPIRQSALLNKIKTMCEDNPVKEYRFNYTKNLYSQLNEIIEIGSDGSRYNSTVFSYNSNNLAPTDYSTNTPPCKNSEYWVLDYNGDGKHDLLQMVWDLTTDNFVEKEWQNWNLLRNEGNNTFAKVISDGVFPENFSPYDNFYPFNKGSVGNMLISNSDFNGDNLDDMMFTTVSVTDNAYYTYTFNPYLSTGTAFQDQIALVGYAALPPNHEYTIRYLDIEGDGRLVIFAHNVNLAEAGYNYVRIRLCGSNVDSSSFTIDSKYEFENSYAIDIDGDGKTELANIYNNDDGNYYIMSDINNSNIFSMQSNNYPGFRDANNITVLVGDFNGDKKSDILKTFTPQSTGPNTAFKWFVEFNKGNNTFDEYEFTDLKSPFLTLEDDDETAWHYTIDINGDGKTDIIEIFNKPGDDYYHTIFSTINVFLSNGHRFIALTPYEIDWAISKTEHNIDFGDFDGDGVLEIFINKGSNRDNGNVHIIDINLTPADFLLKTISNGLNIETNINYKSITDASVYIKGTGAVFPNSDFQESFYVVSSVPINNGMDQNHEINYNYKGAKLHKQGKGFLGFSEITAINTNTGIESFQSFELNPTYFVMQPKISRTKKNGSLISLITNTNAIYKNSFDCLFPYISQSVKYERAKNSTYYTTTFDYGIIGSDYLKFGNVHTVQTNFGVDGSKKEEYTYTEAGAWCPSKPSIIKATINRVLPSTTFTKITNLTYTSGVASKIEVIPGTTTVLQLNSFGLPDLVTVTGTGATTRTIYKYYDNKKRFVTAEKNSLNHKTETVYDVRFGLPLMLKNINNLNTNYTYDGFGQLTTATTPQSNITIYSSTFTGNSGMNNTALFTTFAKMTGVPYLKKSHDIFGRVIKEETQGFDGVLNVTDYSYNENGQLYTKSLPYSNVSDGEIVYSYNDPLGRITNISQPNGSSISYTYLAHTVTITNSSTGEITTKTLDAFDLVTKISGDKSGEISYEYNSRGLLTKAKSPGSTVTMDYDDYGNQDYLDDPNTGYIDYNYNALGELLTQTDAKGTTTITYDEIGRSIAKNHSTGISTSYIYDLESNGKGRIAKINGPNNIKYSFKYDRFGNTVEQVEDIQGSIFLSKYDYDNFGRPVQTTYPNGFVTKSEYDATQGYLKKIMKSDNTIIWEAGTYNQYMQPTKYTTNNGNIDTEKTYNAFGVISGIKSLGGLVQDIEYFIPPSTGLMVSRKDKLQGINEMFTYNDPMKRLKEVWSDNRLTQSIDYDVLGNITHKSDVGDYKYENIPYAVSRVEQGFYLPELPQIMNYTVFQMVDDIKEYVDATNYNYIKFTYGTENERRIMREYTNTALLRTKYYASNFEQEIYTNGKRELCYIMSGDGLCAVFVRNNRSGITQDSMYYIFKDHLGSITTITNGEGIVLQQLSYDAWGKRSVMSGFEKPLFDRGFTGHEHLNAFALINMNGRVYDPVLGRFLSPDNYTQIPGYSQSYNKYSYALNQPLKYTDPSGHFLGMAFWGICYAGNYLGYLLNGYDHPAKRAYAQTNSFTNELGGRFQKEVYKKDNTTISAGFDPFNLGFSANMQIKEEDEVTFNLTAGYGFSGMYANSNISFMLDDLTLSFGLGTNGKNLQFGSGASYSKNGYTFGYYASYFGGKNSQWTGGLSFSKGRFNARIENDILAFQGHDRWRTSAVEVGWDQLVIGTNVYTNDPKSGSQETVDKPSPLWGFNSHEKSAWKEGKVYSSPLYAGFKFGNTISRAGFSAPQIQDATQNFIHRHFPVGYQNYYLDYSEMKIGAYGNYGYYNPYTLY